MVKYGDIINGLKVIDIGYYRRQDTRYILLTLECLECGNTFQKSYNAVIRGNTKCPCKGGYRRHIDEKK